MPFPQVPRPAHILIVDDDETNRIVVRKLCGLFGATADVVETGEDAIVMCATCAYDLVLMDVRMPGMNGIEATHAIRGLPGPAGTTPVVALTADAGARTRELCVEAGVTAFVEKPIGAQKLFEAIAGALAASDESVMAAPEGLAQRSSVGR